jgi:hypothetical protein
VVLPAGVAVDTVHIVADKDASGGDEVDIYPATGESFYGLSANTAIRIKAGQIARFRVTSSGVWALEHGAPVGSVGVNVTANSGGQQQVSLSLATAPWVSFTPTVSGFCTSPRVVSHNNSLAFRINVGTSCAGSTGTVTLAASGSGSWACNFANITAPDTNVVAQTGYTGTTVTVKNYARTSGAAANFTDSDIIVGSCIANQ